MNAAKSMNFPYRLALSTAFSATSRQPILLRGSIQENLRRANDLGYDGIEVHMRPDAEIDAEEIQEVMNETGCGISAVVTGKLFTEMGYSLVEEDSARRLECIDYMKRYIEIAGAFQTDIIIGWVKGNVPDEAEPVEFEERLANSLAELDDFADRLKVNLNMELINRYETNWFNQVSQATRFIQTNQLKRCKIHLDTFHMNIEERDMAEAVRRAGEHLGYVHFADNDRWYPGHGTIQFESVLQALEDVEYEGYVTVECLPLPTGDIAAYMSRENILEIYKQFRQRKNYYCESIQGGKKWANGHYR